MIRLLLIIHVLFYGLVHAQSLTLEDIFLRQKFRERHPEHLTFLKDDRYYTVQQGNTIIKKETESGKIVDTLFNRADTLLRSGFTLSDYQFSNNEHFLLLTGNRKSIYRRSFTADYVVVPLSSTHNALFSSLVVSGGSYAAFSPDGMSLAYVKHNNLFVYNLKSHETVQITSDGIRNKIINGSTDWVYEEEFEFTKAFFWSPDSRFIAFYKFDESQVREYTMQKWEGLYPVNYAYKYPKAGEKLSEISLHVANVNTITISKIPIKDTADFYVPVMSWSENGLVNYLKLERKQTSVVYGTYNPQTAQIQESAVLQLSVPVELEDVRQMRGTILRNKSEERYLNIGENGIQSYLEHLPDTVDIRNLRKIKNEYYFESSRGVHNTSCFKIPSGKSKTQVIATGNESHTMTISESGRYYILSSSSAGKPSVVRLYSLKSKKILRVLEDNTLLNKQLDSLHLQPLEFFTFTTSEQIALRGWTIKPPEFDAGKKYPLIVYVYGGPGHQLVTNNWTGTSYLWHQYLASKGYIVACVDGRGTGGRGTAFRASTYPKLGQLETRDQLETARYLSKFSFVDTKRIGIWGWSFGGYLATSTLFAGDTLIKAAIAVAPVTDWKLYDAVYTERYLNTPASNPTGYAASSLLSQASKLKANYLLIHGTSDDNVHIQNTFALQEALIRAGKQFETFIYPNKAHGIAGAATRLHLYQMMENFWEKKLKE